MILPTILSICMLTGCNGNNDETARVAKSYYVISEELDVKKTADKVQEILENAGAPQSIQTSGSVSAPANITDHQN